MSSPYFADLTSPQADELKRSTPPTVLLLPIGATEPHGPHAPLATDTLISEAMCRRAVERLADDPEVRARILPALPYGVTRYAAAFAGAIHVEPDTLHAVVVDVCRSLIGQGFRHIVLVNNHFEPEQVATLRRVVDTVGPGVGYLDLVRRANAARLTDEFRAGSCHAGQYETSLVLADHPELVDQARLPTLAPVPVDMPAAIAEGRRDFVALGMADAYCGTPAGATREEGEATLATLTDMLIDVIRGSVNLTSWFVDRNVEEGGGARTALLTGDGPTSYAELADLTDRVGNVLLELGVRRGQRVLLALSDGLPFVATWWAAQKIGAVTAEVYTFLSPKDYAYFLAYTEAEVVVVDTVTLDGLRQAGAPSKLVVGVPDDELRPGEHSFDALVAAAPGRLEAAPRAHDDVAIWKFTTGTTGTPKACVHPTRSALLSFDCYARGVLGIGPDDLVLPVPKLFFGYARDLAALFPFGVGGAGVIFPERTTPERIFDLIARHRPTILVNVPTMMSVMVAHPAAAEQDLSCLRLCTSAGEALPAELRRKWQRTFGVEVADGIGSSEAYHIYISNGRVVPGYEARVIDAGGDPVPDGEVGTLEVTGPTVAREYWGAPEKTAATFAGDTLRTGDLFVRDADGFFAYRGRVDDLLKVGGIWVAPSEVEDCLIGHPDVVECAVVGHEDAGLVRARAYVVVRAGAEVTASALIEHARSTLSPHKRPRDVRFVTELPRTTNGKLDRQALRELDHEP